MRGGGYGAHSALSCSCVSVIDSTTQRAIASVVQVASSARWAARRSVRLRIEVRLGRRVVAGCVVLMNTVVVVNTNVVKGVAIRLGRFFDRAPCLLCFRRN